MKIYRCVFEVESLGQNDVVVVVVVVVVVGGGGGGGGGGRGEGGGRCLVVVVSSGKQKSNQPCFFAYVGREDIPQRRHLSYRIQEMTKDVTMMHAFCNTHFKFKLPLPRHLK